MGRATSSGQTPRSCCEGWRSEGVETRQILIGNLTNAHLAYGRGDEEFAAWDGVKQRGLPDWVKVHLQPRGHPAVDLLIPIHVAEFRHASR